MSTCPTTKVPTQFCTCVNCQKPVVDILQIERLAMRQEGGNWNAYYALPDSMEGAIFLGSIRMGAVMRDPDRKKAFMGLMRDIVTDIIEEKTGHRPTWPDEPMPAPENERSGNG